MDFLRRLCGVRHDDPNKPMPYVPEDAAVDALDKNIYAASHKHNINVLPVLPNFDIQNLYPITDRVEQWNVLVVGSDKTYILASLKDPFMRMDPPDAETLLPNRQGPEVLPAELNAFFDPVWDKTLLGRQLQFYILWNERLYFINTYPFFNSSHRVIGAILFMRAFHSLPPMPNALTAETRQAAAFPSTPWRKSHEQTLECIVASRAAAPGSRKVSPEQVREKTT